MPEFVRRSRIDAPPNEVFAWHARPGAFERLVPPWESIRVIERTGGIEDGARAVLELRAGPAPIRWTAEHSGYVEGRQFVDEQRGGPFRHWRHTHSMFPDPPDGCVLEDRIEYALPLGPLGALANRVAVVPRLDRTFRYRHRVTRDDIDAHRRYAGTGTLSVAVTGSSGLIGSRLVPLLTTGGHHVTRIHRGGSGFEMDPATLDGVDAVVHLAGANVAAHRWTERWKREIADSRIGLTRRLAETLAARERPPRVLVCASAIGIYGHRPGETLTEASDPGTGFLADVCRDWEAAAQPARDAGIRVVSLRFGVVLSPAGGALAQLLPVFRLGLGGRLGGGDMSMSWIEADDAAGAVYHALATASLEGAVNATAPVPVTNAEFTRTLARTVRRPALVPVPAVALRIAVGEMADAVLFSSAHVEPARLVSTGYRFRFPELGQALAHLTGRRSTGAEGFAPAAQG